MLNKYFAQVSSITNKPDVPIHGPVPPSFNNENLLELFITEEEVDDQLCIINSSKPPGPDGRSPRFLKGISTSLKIPLTKLFNISLRLRKLQDLWKIAQITPIFKNKGSAQEAANYRPISLTSALCKLIEKILFKHLHNYMIDNNIIYKYQSGFQPGDSTVNQLVEIYNTIISSLDKGIDIRFIFCDISKAFDKVWHNGLLVKLQNYGICGSVLGWIENYLFDRSCNRWFYI